MGVMRAGGSTATGHASCDMPGRTPRNTPRSTGPGMANDTPHESPQQQSGGPPSTEALQAEKMRAMGTFAAHIAHDFNNVLTAILGQVGLLGEALAEGDLAQASGDLGNVEAAARRGAELVGKLMGFSRMQPLERVPLSAGDLVENAAPFLRVLLPPRVEVVTRVTEDCWIDADPVFVEHMLMNLASNARDAMPEGGQIRIEAGVVNLTESECRAQGWGTPGHFAVIRVDDTGPGIPAELVSKVLDPFFTTKPVGEGTGLGLSMVYGLMKQHGGWIHIDRTPEGGARFDLLFPRTERPAGEAGEEPSAEFPRGSGCIVVAEDDAMTRAALARVLKRSGYTVRTASDGLEALAILQHWPEVDLLVTDIAMPRLGGVALGKVLEKQGLRVPILFTSGLGREHAEVAQGLPADALFLAKPWTVAEILARVGEVMTGARGS
ncbi:MAG: response regulator [Gemmatimonadales bacterium]|nr:MAG: response regulator [Gemmatimonadales bacterium]